MSSDNRALTINELIRPDDLAWQLTQKFQEWDMLRNRWLSQKDEIREYIFAIDTTVTSNNILPWKNNTHIPKLCQVRDNLHANYMAALFPNDRPIDWEGDDEDSESKEKRRAIESYMENKMRLSGFRTEVSKCILDWIDYGNCFAQTEFINEVTTDPLTGEQIQGYVGPKMRRISPLDITFNPTTADFSNTPKFVRTLTTIGSLRADMLDHPEMGYLENVFQERFLVGRHRFQGLSHGDFSKTEDFQVAGFGSFIQYFQSDYVEILDFYGDYYDQVANEFYKNRLITIVDRAYIIRNVPNPSWLGKPNIFHCGWRPRQDNLYAMGPLDNLVGMQYRIDHLENAKADAFDLIIHPVMKVKGFVEDFIYGPGERIFCGDDGDVEFEKPDVTMLQANTEIQMYEETMEQMAGAPKQAMGFRTPGEKTAFEVQILENGSNRVFLNKTSYFEEVFMEPALNSMLEISRRNMGPSDVVRVMDDQFGVVEFMKITKEDITAKGKIRPIGARHFMRNANIIQNLTQLNAGIGQDEAVKVHISGKGLAHLVEELLDLERYGLVQDNIRVAEQLETQRLMNAGAALMQQQNQMQGTPNPNQPQQPEDTTQLQRGPLLAQRSTALTAKQGEVPGAQQPAPKGPFS